MSAFDQRLEMRLAEVENELSEKSKSLLQDLKYLRQLLTQMEQMDAVTFYQSLEVLKKDEKVRRESM